MTPLRAMLAMTLMLLSGWAAAAEPAPCAALRERIHRINDQAGEAAEKVYGPKLNDVARRLAAAELAPLDGDAEAWSAAFSAGRLRPNRADVRAHLDRQEARQEEVTRLRAEQTALLDGRGTKYSATADELGLWRLEEQYRAQRCGLDEAGCRAASTRSRDIAKEAKPLEDRIRREEIAAGEAQSRHSSLRKQTDRLLKALEQGYAKNDSAPTPAQLEPALHAAQDEAHALLLARGHHRRAAELRRELAPQLERIHRRSNLAVPAECDSGG